MNPKARWKHCAKCGNEYLRIFTGVKWIGKCPCAAMREFLTHEVK